MNATLTRKRTTKPKRTATVPPREMVIDSFAGGGGASLGISRALGRCPDVAINHSAAAIAMHAENHPKTRHLTEDVWKADPREVTAGRDVGLLWASPDCKHFSRAKGGKPVSKNIRSLAWVVVKWAAEVSPRIIILENVREFADWGPLVPRWTCLACGWKGTEGQATLARKRPKCPTCEGKVCPVEELIPDPTRKGLTFRRFVGRLKALGYAVQFHVLNAADYGAPTHRRRLFLIARRDGKPIVWPEPTHGDPKKIGKDLFNGALKPWRTAAECIDWTIPCPSIFERKTPLRPNTLRRIAHGIKRYVLDSPKPFIVQCNHSGPEFRGQSIDDPMCTVTASRDAHGLIMPSIVRIGQTGSNGSNTAAANSPLSTVTTKAEHCLITPILQQFAHGDAKDGRNRGLRAKDLDHPIGTIHAGGGNFGLVAATLAQVGYGEREGQAPRAMDIEAPMGTTVAGGCKQALVTAFIAKHFGGNLAGASVKSPLPTTTVRGTQNQLVAANLIHLNHGDKQWSGIDEPTRTMTATGNHAALVYSFLVQYYGTSIGQPVTNPLNTATTKDRFGLVTVEVDGEPYVIADIGMRMLRPRELARAQGFPDDYKLTGNATSQVERIGNSVCPVMAEVLVKANY